MDLDIALVGVGFPLAKELGLVIEDACLVQEISELVDHKCSVKGG